MTLVYQVGINVMCLAFSPACIVNYVCEICAHTGSLHTPVTSFRVMKEIFQVFITILDVILLLLFFVVVFAIFGKYDMWSSLSR